MTVTHTILSREEVVGNQDWRSQANCHNLPLEMFFPEPGAHIGKAKAVCAQCPVQQHCLSFGVHMGEKHGLWGGYGDKTLRKIRREQRIPVIELDIDLAA